jgi:hypothetical protein
MAGNGSSVIENIEETTGPKINPNNITERGLRRFIRGIVTDYKRNANFLCDEDLAYTTHEEWWQVCSLLRAN